MSRRNRRSSPVAIMPGKHVDITPEGAGNGLLIIGESGQSLLCAAKALMQAAAEMRLRT